ncbi:MAG: FtsW/RodA/SpoVE family cell cycle protein, partial [Bacteroidetes bacterium]|nr:FtsW/RodA/SpoVE family cell cycle protein [Bacteroidota bacterium]
YGKPWIFLLKQLLWVGLGVAGVFVVLQVDYRRLRQPASIFTALFLVSSLLVGVLFMEASRNTHRWLKLGSFSLQPSEFSKLVLILFLAYFLERQQKRFAASSSKTRAAKDAKSMAGVCDGTTSRSSNRPISARTSMFWQSTRR